MGASRHRGNWSASVQLQTRVTSQAFTQHWGLAGTNFPRQEPATLQPRARDVQAFRWISLLRCAFGLEHIAGRHPWTCTHKGTPTYVSELTLRETPYPVEMVKLLVTATDVTREEAKSSATPSTTRQCVHAIDRCPCPDQEKDRSSLCLQWSKSDGCLQPTGSSESRSRFGFRISELGTHEKPEAALTLRLAPALGASPPGLGVKAERPGKETHELPYRGVQRNRPGATGTVTVY